MKRLFLTFVVVLGCASAAWAAAPAPLTSLRAIRALTNAQASRKVPVAFEATVNYVRSYESLLFVQDGDSAIFVRPPLLPNWLPAIAFWCEETRVRVFTRS